MKADEKKPTQGVANGKPSNGSQTTALTPNTAAKEEAKAELKKVNAIERILNDLEVLNNRRENREHLLESRKKLKAFNPTITEGLCTLTIQDNKGNHFKTTHSEALKLVIGNYTAIVERKLEEVKADIANLANRLGA